MARAVEMAVRLTESSILALLSEDMKLLILPPGQVATSIIPIAIEKIWQAREQVSAGR